jgi:DNA polymerase III epsilon subunit family exonuclease
MREIVLDTETTGLDPLQGHRLVEIGAVELFNHIPTGKTYHTYINPQRDVPREAEAVHGLSSAFLKDKPLFSTIADELLEFIGDTALIIHNASFDVGFLNAELGFIKRPPILYERIIDTELVGGRQITLTLPKTGNVRHLQTSNVQAPVKRSNPLPERLTAEELARHEALVKSLGVSALWKAT